MGNGILFLTKTPDEAVIDKLKIYFDASANIVLAQNGSYWREDDFESKLKCSLKNKKIYVLKSAIANRKIDSSFEKFDYGNFIDLLEKSGAVITY
ncbi:MAG: hypothetical protein ACN4E2_04405 [Nitrospinota bacterium]